MMMMMMMIGGGGGGSGVFVVGVTMMIIPPTGFLHLPVQREYRLPRLRLRLPPSPEPPADRLPQADAVQVPLLHLSLIHI